MELIDRLRAALDAEVEDVELSIRNEIDGYRADGGLVVTREEMLEDDADGEPSPYRRRLRMVAAHRKILDEIVDEANGLDLSVDLDRRVGPRDDAEEPLLGNVLVRILAEAYGIAA